MPWWGRWSRAGAGAFELPLRKVIGGLLAPLGLASAWAPDAQGSAVLWSLRLPRVALSLLVGAGLSVAGVLLQALFRNPLASPQVIGVSSGASLGAAVAIVLGGAMQVGGAPVLLPLSAFIGALGAAFLVLQLGRAELGRSVATLLLAGIVTNAICGAGLGLLFFLADDAQLRSLTFWTLGSLGGARWSVVGLVGLGVGALLLGARQLAARLDLLQLGEEEALMLGVDVPPAGAPVVVPAQRASLWAQWSPSPASSAFSAWSSRTWPACSWVPPMPASSGPRPPSGLPCWCGRTCSVARWSPPLSCPSAS